VAWWAHIAGFVFGWVVMALTTRKERSRARLVE